MDSEAIAQHIETVRRLSKPGQALGVDAPTATMANPAWWRDGTPTPARDRLHQRLLEEVRASFPGVASQGRALVLAGPPGAGKGAVKKDVLGDQIDTFLNVDADVFKELLLREAGLDGTYESWIVPDVVRELRDAGEPFFPLELASLVHEESSYLAAALRSDAIAAGDNVIVDTVLGSEAAALALGKQLSEAGYRVQIADVEVPFALSEARIRERWEKSYSRALENGAGLGGRWVPSEYARGVFDGPDGRSHPEANARRLAESCPAVTRFRVFRTGMDQAHLERATPTVDVDLKRATPGAELRSVPAPHRASFTSAPPRETGTHGRPAPKPPRVSREVRRDSPTGRDK